ncbi:hypothetical protein LIA77_09149 [Sarocladium implicatum]|nr:hypothetical protein LIA77_09149 [Sarocladium implicatum]
MAPKATSLPMNKPSHPGMAGVVTVDRVWWAPCGPGISAKGPVDRSLHTPHLTSPHVENGRKWLKRCSQSFSLLRPLVPCPAALVFSRTGSGLFTQSRSRICLAGWLASGNAPPLPWWWDLPEYSLNCPLIVQKEKRDGSRFGWGKVIV